FQRDALDETAFRSALEKALLPQAEAHFAGVNGTMVPPPHPKRMHSSQLHSRPVLARRFKRSSSDPQEFLQTRESEVRELVGMFVAGQRRDLRTCESSHCHG